jgi:hypothetical protein
MKNYKMTADEMIISKGDLNIAAMLRKTGGKFFSLTFEKKDGTIRHMVARIGVRKGVKGTGTQRPENIFTIFDIQKGEFRCFAAERLISIKCGWWEYTPSMDVRDWNSQDAIVEKREEEAREAEYQRDQEIRQTMKRRLDYYEAERWLYQG